MIRHIHVFNLKAEVDQADREWLFDQIRTKFSSLPTVRRLAIGKAYQMLDESGKPKRPIEYDWALTMEFDDAMGLDQYAKHPDHRGFAPEILKRISTMKVMDFES